MCSIATCFPYVRFSRMEDMEVFAKIHCGHFVPVDTGNASIRTCNGDSMKYYHFVHDPIKPLQM